MKRLFSTLILVLIPNIVWAQQEICLDEADASLRRVPIHLVDITDGYTPEPGLTLSGSDVQFSANGTSYTNGSGTIGEIGSGDYYYVYDDVEVAVPGFRLLKVEKPGTTRVFTAHHQVKVCVTKEEIADTTIARAFTQDTGETYSSAVAGSVVKEIADNAAGGGGTADWTSGEQQQIRSALGIDGTKTAATGGQLQALQTDVSGIDTKVDTVDNNVDAVLLDTSTGVAIADGYLTASKFAQSFFAAFFTTDSGESGSGDAGSVVREIVDNVSGGGGGGDWTADEQKQIRNALGIDGDKSIVAEDGQLQDLRSWCRRR